MRYGIQWDIVAAAPLIIGLLLADHLGQGRKKRKKQDIEEQKREKEEAKAAKATEKAQVRAGLVTKRRSGFRRMKSNAQRIRDRQRKMETAAAEAGISIEELHDAMENYAATIRPQQIFKPRP